MRSIIGNVIYEFNVSRDESASSTPSVTNTPAEEFQIDVQFRKFQAPSRLPEIELRRSLRIPRTGSEGSMATLMVEVLQELGVPEQNRKDMALHFKFYVERLSRRDRRRRGVIPMAVTLEEKVISPDRAAEIHRRMEAGRRENRWQVAEREAAIAAAPAKKSAVESLVRERARSEEAESECAICLERFAVGAEVIRMPCLHVYHKDCIIRWLKRAHFCPFCRFELPS